MKYLVFSQHIRKSEEFSNAPAAVDIIMDYNGQMTFAKAYDEAHENCEGDEPKTANELKKENKRQYFLQLKKHIKAEAAKLVKQLEEAKPGDIINYHLCEIKVIDDANATGVGVSGGCCGNSADAF